ncbi:hypothetical protein GQ53DRAFT_336383 [Thozetella sp. PMI_491]|nr:hypothetical protein GQ53DRAFT_336383 [Thozetella sp. PMI_491]
MTRYDERRREFGAGSNVAARPELPKDPKMSRQSTLDITKTARHIRNQRVSTSSRSTTARSFNARAHTHIPRPVESQRGVPGCDRLCPGDWRRGKQGTSRRQLPPSAFTVGQSVTVLFNPRELLRSGECECENRSPPFLPPYTSTSWGVREGGRGIETKDVASPESWKWETGPPAESTNPCPTPHRTLLAAKSSRSKHKSQLRWAG